MNNKSVKANIACILNFPAHYRQNIYLKMEKELNCDFYFGNIREKNIEIMDFYPFSNPIKKLRTVRLFSNFNWIKGSIGLVFKPYRKYILVGEPYCLSTWVILLFNRLLGKKTYLWTHGWYGDESVIKIKIKILFFKLCNGVFLYGDYAKNLMLNEGFDKNKLHVIYNSLDYDKQLKVRSQIKKSNIFKDFFKNENPIIFFIGRLTKVKKLDYLIDSLILLNKKNIRVNLVFIGEGEEKEHLMARVINENLTKKIWFYGTTYNEKEIGELIYNADICVSPGNIGLTAMHSLVYGTPIITHNNFKNQMPEFECVLSGVTGLFFKENDIIDLSETINNWLNNSKSRVIIRENCFNMIDQHYNPYLQINLLKRILIDNN